VKKMPTAHRLALFSDAVIAVIITVMVLELKAPEEPPFSALLPLWPTAISYAVSYLFIAIIWTNHHYLMGFVGPPTLRLIWINFAHLFMVSLVPFATAWIARTRLAAAPVALYTALFACVDIAYNVFEREILTRAEASQVSERARRPDPPRAAGGNRQSAMTVLQGMLASRAVGPRRVPQPKEQQWDFHGSRGPWGTIRTEGSSQQARCPGGCPSRSHCAAE
jgi:uncharacterized membrane protein